MGTTKALLRLPSGEALVARAAHALVAAGTIPVLVGRAGPEVIAAAAEGLPPALLPLRVIDDARASSGPLGGLVALLEAALAAADPVVVALACDMPGIGAALLARLVAAPPAAVVAPRRGDHWEPLCARYDARRVHPVASARLAAADLALQGLLRAVATIELDRAPGPRDDDASRAALADEAFDDVDTAGDAARRGIAGAP